MRCGSAGPRLQWTPAHWGVQRRDRGSVAPMNNVAHVISAVTRLPRLRQTQRTTAD